MTARSPVRPGPDAPRDGGRSTLVWDVLQQVVAARAERAGRAALDIVDVGGGTGGFAVPLAELGHTVTVLDPSPDALAGARRRAAERQVRLATVQGDADELDQVAGDDAVDLVICHSVLDYIEEPAAAMSAIARVLRPGGTVSVIAANAVAAVLHRALSGRYDQASEILSEVTRGSTNITVDGRRRFTLVGLTALIEDAGLRVGDAYGVRVLAGLLPAADADPGAAEGLRGLEDEAAAYPALRDIAARLHVLAERLQGVGTPGDAGCNILHVDMDAFYASVEVRDQPELAGQPVVVAALGARGVVLSATYEARAFGVRSAMPVTRARRLCPQAVYIQPRHKLYSEVSREAMAIFRAITPEVEPLSLDEAFLDVTGSLRRLAMTPAQIAESVRAQVREQQAITCSVGVAPVKFVAKIASARCKPDGMLVVPEDGVLDFLHPLPASALWGVGDKAEEVLAKLGLRTIGDIAHVPEQTLQRELGAAVGTHLWALAWGRDERRVVPRREEKSVGAEETFPADVDDPEVIRRELLRLSDRTARALRAAGCVAKTVTVKLRLASFKTITRSRTLHESTDVSRVIYATACALYEGSGLDARARLRLVGVRASGLRPAAGASTQLAFGDRPVGWREAEQAVDEIARKFGDGVIRPAALVADRREPPSPVI